MRSPITLGVSPVKCTISGGEGVGVGVGEGDGDGSSCIVDGNGGGCSVDCDGCSVLDGGSGDVEVRRK